jgi:hypothetical protein
MVLRSPHDYLTGPTRLGSSPPGPYRSKIRCGIRTSRRPAHHCLDRLRSRTEKATFYGTIVGDKIWPAADQLQRGCTRPRCATTTAPMQSARRLTVEPARRVRGQVNNTSCRASSANMDRCSSRPWTRRQRARLSTDQVRRLPHARAIDGDRSNCSPELAQLVTSIYTIKPCARCG